MNFDDIKKYDEENNEYWTARELQEVLEYKEWRNFNKVIETAKIACTISQQEISYHFVEVNKPIIGGKGAIQNVKDYKLTRYACYLIVMNGDPRKEVIAKGQTYFAVKTRQQELNELYDKLTENERRLFLRSDIKQKNMLLSEAAHRAGIETRLEYAIFQDNGYMGLYGGETAKIIAARKGIDKGEDILDYMGSEELGANLFRITQTEAKIKRENISTPSDANNAHYEVGKKVRKAIIDIGGTLPEELPTPEKSIKEIEKEKNKQIKRTGK